MSYIFFAEHASTNFNQKITSEGYVIYNQMFTEDGEVPHLGILNMANY
ncbi:MAG TPA: hypothetical protein VK175_15870 [Leadbetterella sp.]|nr:hypothetical protein [Leadbetterella sp.]